jgi:hypothetical protein
MKLLTKNPVVRDLVLTIGGTIKQSEKGTAKKRRVAVQANECLLGCMQRCKSVGSSMMFPIRYLPLPLREEDPETGARQPAYEEHCLCLIMWQFVSGFTRALSH